MPVLSHEEYEDFKKESKTKNERLIKVIDKQEKVGEQSPTFKTIWYLLHPENGTDDFQNFEDVIKIEGKDYKRVCKNGIIRTSLEPLAKFLLNKGYMLLEKEQKNVL